MGRSLEILVVTQFFHPEMGAPAARFHDFGRLLVERGHKVTVITGFPNSPSGMIPDQYRGRWRTDEHVDGIRVRRSWIYASPTLSSTSKSMGFLSFASTASLRSLFGGLPRADVVVATSPPPTVGIPGLIASKRLRAPLIFDVRDIWPEAIAASGRLHSGVMVRTLERIERFIYSHSAGISVVTDGKRERLLAKGVPDEKIAVIPNGVDLDRFAEAESADSLLSSQGVDTNKFLVLYAGIFNPAQGLDVIFDCAHQLRKRDAKLAERVQFVLVGAGSEKARLEARRRSEGLEDQIVLVDEQPREKVPAILNAADSILVTLRPRRDTHTVPSKLYEALASGRPVLVSADGAPAEMCAQSEGGLASAAGDPVALAASVAKLAEDEKFASGLAEHGRRYAASFDRRLLADRFEALLYRVADESSRS